MAEKKGFIAEFKEFIMRGNVLDMAVGVVVGGAFTAIVNAVVEDLLTPIIGLIMGGVDFGEWTVAGFAVGHVINAIISFLITAFVVFLIVKAVNKVETVGKHKEEAPAEEEAPAAPTEAELLIEIRDLLKANQPKE